MPRPRAAAVHHEKSEDQDSGKDHDKKARKRLGVIALAKACPQESASPPANLVEEHFQMSYLPKREA